MNHAALRELSTLGKNSSKLLSENGYSVVAIWWIPPARDTRHERRARVCVRAETDWLSGIVYVTELAI